MTTAIPKPRTFKADLAKLPAALLPLTLEKRWVIWKLERRGDRWTKPPYQPKFYNELAESDDPSTWGTYADAVLAIAQGHADGIGYMLKGSGLAAIDLDRIRDLLSGRVLPWAEALFTEAIAAGAYIEWTVSGTGARIIGLAAGDKLHRKMTCDRASGCACEFYRDCERYITISGMQILPGDYPGLPVPTAVPEFDVLFDTLYARFADAKLRPAASECEFAAGLVISVEEIPAGEAPSVLDFNDAGPQVDYHDLIANSVPVGDRSEAFQAAVWHLAAQGKTVEEIVAELAAHPGGIAAKYAGRLEEEVTRSFGKWKAERQARAGGLAVPTGAASALAQGGGAAGGSGGVPPSPPSMGHNSGATGAGWVPFPTIHIRAGEIKRVVDQAEQVLANCGQDFYQRGSSIVRPAVMSFKVGDREERGWGIEVLFALQLVEELTAAAQWKKFDKKGNEIHIDCPDRVCHLLVARRGRWKFLPRLAGLIHTPFLRVDGTICETPGYDQASQLLYIPDGIAYSPVPQFPTKVDAVKAIELLLDVVKDFRFVVDETLSPSDPLRHLNRLVWLSAVLTTLDRRSMAKAPLHGFSAFEYGSGKSLLVDLCNILATGRGISVANQGWDDEELRKELGALLVKGVAAFSLDNCERPLGGAFLCKVLSQTHVGVRILGSTRVEETISNAMPFATGDNLTTLRDMARRTLISVIDAGDRPELREFKETADAIALRRRPELVVAALTVLRAWHVLPTQEKGGVKAGPLGGYEEWIRRIAKPLVWIGQGDPSKAVERSRKTDPARKALVAVLLQWERLIGVDVPKTSKEVVDLAINDAVFYDVLVVAAGKSGKVNSYQLGAWISRYARGKSVAGITTGLLNLREATTDPSGIDRWVLRRG